MQQKKNKWVITRTHNQTTYFFTNGEDGHDRWSQEYAKEFENAGDAILTEKEALYYKPRASWLYQVGPAPVFRAKNNYQIILSDNGDDVYGQRYASETQWWSPKTGDIHITRQSAEKALAEISKEEVKRRKAVIVPVYLWEPNDGITPVDWYTRHQMDDWLRGLPKDEWATIGDRIDEFARIYKAKGDLAAWDAIKEAYIQKHAEPDNIYDYCYSVYNGLLVFLFMGVSAYYSDPRLDDPIMECWVNGSKVNYREPIRGRMDLESAKEIAEDYITTDLRTAFNISGTQLRVTVIGNKLEKDYEWTLTLPDTVARYRELLKIMPS